MLTVHDDRFYGPHLPTPVALPGARRSSEDGLPLAAIDLFSPFSICFRQRQVVDSSRECQVSFFFFFRDELAGGFGWP